MKYYVEVVETVKLKKVVPVDAKSYTDAARIAKRNYENKKIILSEKDLYRIEAPQNVDFYVRNDSATNEKNKRLVELQNIFISIGHTLFDAMERADEFLAEENLTRRRCLTGQLLVEELLKQGESLHFADRIFEDRELEHKLAEEVRAWGA